MTFVEQRPYINPARISPARIVPKPMKNSAGDLTGVMRLTIDGEPAICMSAGLCYDRHLVTAVLTRATDALLHKYIALLFHSQEWQRWEAFMCMCFNQPRLYTSMVDSAVEIGTVKIRPTTHDTGMRTVLTACVLYSVVICSWAGRRIVRAG